MDFDVTQSQLAVNLHNRLIANTTGAAFQIVGNVPRYSGVEAWRLLNFQFDPRTDARLTSLVLSIVGYKIKGKGVQAGLVLWEAQLLASERDHKETLSPKVRRALLMNVLPAAMQGRIMERLDRLKTYAEVREKIITLCQSSIDEADIGNVDNDGAGEVTHFVARGAEASADS